MLPFYASVEDENGREASGGKIPGPTPEGSLMEYLRPNMGRYVVDAPPGRYRLNVDPGAWDKRYTIKIEECGT